MDTSLDTDETDDTITTKSVLTDRRTRQGAANHRRSSNKDEKERSHYLRYSRLLSVRTGAGIESVTMDEATEITEQLYIGPLTIARDLEALKKLKISAVICAAAEGRKFFPDEFDYFEMPQLVEQTCGADNIVNALDDIWSFASEKLSSDKRIFVHCVHGRTRSSSILSYLLAKQRGITFKEAYDIVLSKRDVFIPEDWIEALQKKLESA